MEELEKQGLSVFEDIEKPLIPVVQEMQRNGVLLDTPYLKRLSKTYHKKLETLAKKIYKHAGEEFNINSPKQLGDILFDTLGLVGKAKTTTGQRSTREAALEKLIDDHPIIQNILDYRELQKLLSTYIDNMPHMVHDDGRLHATFLQAGAATGRMASQNPGTAEHPHPHEAR